MKELDTIEAELSRHVNTQKDLTEVMGHLTKTMLEKRASGSEGDLPSR